MSVGVSGLKTQLSVINWTFFPRIQILIFLHETTQNDHNRMLYTFENDQKNLAVLGVVVMRQLLLKRKHYLVWAEVVSNYFLKFDYCKLEQYYSSK